MSPVWSLPPLLPRWTGFLQPSSEGATGLAPAFAPFLLPCRTWRVRCWAALRVPVPSSQAFRTEEWMLCSDFLLTRGEKFTGGTFFLEESKPKWRH